MYRLIALAMLGAGVSPGFAQVANSQTAAQSSAVDAAPGAPAYVAMAGSSDKYEKESSQLVLSQTASPAVQSFAQMMINDHAQTTANLMAAMKASHNLSAPKLLTPEINMLRDLRAAPKDKMERTYVDQQVLAHQKALALHQNYAAKGEDSNLRAAAAAAVPIVQRHLDEITRIQAAMGGPLPR